MTAILLSFSSFASSIRTQLHHIADNYVVKRHLGTLLSTYSHKNTWDFSTEIPEIHSNCYGFINFLLKRHFPNAHQELLSFMTNNTSIPVSIDGIPCPFHFSAFFEEAKKSQHTVHSFSYVTHDDVQPGDIIVYEPPGYTPLEDATFSTKPTGTHVMIVKEVISSEENNLTLRIIDCTRRHHDKYHDSRAKLPKEKRGGIGTAQLHLKKGDDGHFNRLHWFAKKKIYHKKITIGRLAGDVL